MTHPPLEEVSFVVLSTPVAQPRQRHAAKVLGGGQVRSFNYVPKDHRVHEYKYALQQAAKQHPKLSGPLHLGASLYLPRPQRLCRKKDPPGPLWCDAAKTDCDNFAKAILDALTGISYEDDRQVCTLYISKQYAAKGDPPHVVILIQQLPTADTDSSPEASPSTSLPQDASTDHTTASETSDVTTLPEAC